LQCRFYTNSNQDSNFYIIRLTKLEVLRLLHELLMRRATKIDKALVVDILMSAFIDIKEGNSLNYFIKGEHNREKRAEHLFNYLFDKSIITGEIYIASNEKGCILVDRSSKKQYSLGLFLKKLRTVYLSIGFLNIPRILQRQKLIDRFHTDKNHVYPSAMAAHSSVNGKGTCVRMIMELLKTYNDEPITIYTETSTQENLNIYKRFGFEVKGESDELGFKIYFLALKLNKNEQS